MKNSIIVIILLMMFSLNNLYLYDNYFIKQVIWYLISFVFLYIGYKIDKNIFYKLIYVLYYICSLLLLYLLFNGDVINGSRGWIKIFKFSFQPSEFMKIILIVLLNISIFNSKYKCILYTLIPSILTLLEPDTGNVIFYIIILINVYLINNKLNIKYIFIGLVSFLIGIFILFNNSNYRLNRITNMFDNYQINRALVSIRYSGLFGNGNIINVPFSESDFAFTLLISKVGLVGTIIYLLLILFLFNNVYKISISNNLLLRNIGITFLLVFCVQTIINIFMNIGLCPITGITLPFISYGGSSLICYMFMIGFINNCKDKV